MARHARSLRSRACLATHDLPWDCCTGPLALSIPLAGEDKTGQNWQRKSTFQFRSTHARKPQTLTPQYGFTGGRVGGRAIARPRPHTQRRRTTPQAAGPKHRPHAQAPGPDPRPQAQAPGPYPRPQATGPRPWPWALGPGPGLRPQGQAAGSGGGTKGGGGLGGPVGRPELHPSHGKWPPRGKIFF